ncbi:phage tail protein [Vibrio cincinnatiensis]|uniref:phage tail-collar fiber domain-containing protein n=1 Tax=Vibrio cincinnatiensis TaxID=675 RepID=UPI001EDCE9FE|nr:phage tail protein [Vibrio cincinnatiensis]MCG3724778.1 hypothetical protein [Vibrio cincinnatiensis]
MANEPLKTAVVTNVGIVKLEAAYQAGEKVIISQMALGNSNLAYVVPDPAFTELVNEFGRQDINEGNTTDSWINALVYVDSQRFAGESILEFGLYDTGGDLIVYSSYTPSVVPAVGQDYIQLEIECSVDLYNASAVTIEVTPIYPQATELERGIAKMATKTDAMSGTNSEKIMSPLRVKEVVTQFGYGIESPPLLGNFNETAIVNGQMFRTDGSTSGTNPVPGTNGYVRYERWGANDFVQYFWPATVTDAQLWFRRWKSGVFQGWIPFFTTINEKQIGYNQTYQDETANRQANIAYKNIYGKPIMVSTNIQSGGKLEVSADGTTWLEINTWSSISGAPTTPIIPPNWWYRATAYYGKWMELK